MKTKTPETNTSTVEDATVEKPIKKSSKTKKEVVKEVVEEDWKDKYYRLYADFDNYKRRAQKEKEDLILDIKTKSLSTILDLDNDLYIAKKNMPDSEGLNLILNKVHNSLKSQGIEEIQTDEYDSDLHEVISIIETGESKIIDIVSKGYKINGKPFRYPKIILSK
jgi:molecular chaperone GrpE